MNRRLTVALAIGSLACASAAPVAAQQSTSPTPPVVALSTPTIVKKPKVQTDRYKGRVLSFNLAQMIVQSTENEKLVWTFQYSPEMRDHVTSLLNSGGYQYGDRVQVFCTPGTKVAVKIKGKPSKS